MKLFRLLIVLCALALFGAMIGYYLSKKQTTAPASKATPNPIVESPPKQTVFDFPEIAADTPVGIDIQFPRGAIEGELVVHFSDRQNFLAYLAALKAADIQPLSQIDELLAVRIPEEALLLIDYGRYGAGASYSLIVERPPPPAQLDPAALASLRAYGASARNIVEGYPHGDGSGVLVGVLDSGIQAHPQFDDIDIIQIDLSGAGVASPGAEHGTSVASIITGKEGIAPNAKLLAVRVLDGEGMGNSSHVAEGIVQAVDLGAQVINLSLGVYQDTPLLRQAVNYAAERGVILVAAAGNDGYAGMPYPAAYEEVLSVTALDANQNQAVFPNQSEAIDFAAPGVGIRTAKEDEGTTLFSGTSAAAPFVAATLVSLLSGDEPMEPDAAVDLLRRYLNDAGAPGADPLYGAGAVDWDRLRERDEVGLLDVALAGIHLSPDALPGTTMPVQVTVQNRGTKWLNEAQLEVLIDEAEPVSFTIGTLGPGQTTTRKVFTQMPSLGSEETLSLAARVLPEDVNEEVRLENNLKAVQFRPRSP